MNRLRLTGVVAAVGALLALPAACSGDSFSADNNGAAGSGGSSSGSGGKSGQGGSMSHSGSTSEGGEGIEPGTGGSVVSTGGEGGDPGMGTGGSVNVGGSGMTDGGAPSCAEGSIQFQMKPGPNVDPGYFCTQSCLAWVAVYSHVVNRWLPLSRDCSVNDCETCAIPTCDDACFSDVLTAQGVERNWDGTHYGNNVCMSNLGIDVSCQEPVCLPVGSYEARMCAYVNVAGTPDMCQPDPGNQICKDVSFNYEGGELTVAAEISP